MSETAQTLSFSIVKTEMATNTRNQNEPIRILFGVYSNIFVKGGQATVSTEVQVTSLFVKPKSTICLGCLRKFVHVVHEYLSMLCMAYFEYSFLSIFCMTLSLTSNFHILYNKFHIFQ